MKKGKIRVLAALVLLLAAIPGTMEAKAKERGESGRVQLELPDLGTEKAGVEFGFWLVGQVDKDGRPTFDPVYGISDYPDTAAGLEEAAQQVSRKVEGEPLFTITTDAAGRACAEHVERGLYLIMAAEKNPYGQVSPFLVPVPYLDGETGTVFYEITAEPKASPYEEEKPETPGDPNPPGTPDTPRPTDGAQTGDDAPLERYVVIAVISLSGLLLFAAYDRAKKRKQKEGREKE